MSEGLTGKSPTSSPTVETVAGRTIITRLDSLGGFGIQVPCVYWVRRSRPRKNVTALLKFHPSGMGMTTMFIKRGLDVHGSQKGNESMNKVLEAKSTPKQTPQQFVVESNKEKSSADIGQNMELKYVDHREILQMIVLLLCQLLKGELEGNITELGLFLRTSVDLKDNCLKLALPKHQRTKG
ncbi:hypothetical protein F3Y22_tig00111678pilonHSYRG00021 [Hibiscus syriacus]|uniref:Uncharacterized protein n=1 Tax=Hibiscus syriacus TaxID=106335 RepID=A0A6A2XHM9_HIBSY|nr:hypothetical protein F3Y22_tig00111678pilonHSYRG00021 [Hibiscus syriacus]